MPANARTKDVDLTRDPPAEGESQNPLSQDPASQELEAEIRQLRRELKVMADQLAQQATGAENADQLPNLRSADQNLYVFDDEDEIGVAFDAFFTAPDPGLDKIRSFLLD